MRLKPQTISGKAYAIGAKAHAHRVLLASALCKEDVKIYGLNESEDVLSTINCLKALGVAIKKEEDVYLVGKRTYLEEAFIDVGESGTTLRLILPLLGFFANKVHLTAQGRLPKRPLKELIEALKKGGVSFSRESLPFSVSGFLKAGEYALVGDVSSQYFSGLLLASPLVKEMKIIATTQLESEKYIDLTLSVLEAFGVLVKKENNTYLVQQAAYQGIKEVVIEGDWSNAAPWLAFAALGGKGVSLKGLSLDSPQGDKAILDLLKDFGAKVIWQNDEVFVSADKKKPLKVDMAQIPDLLPVLAILACGAEGRSIFYNAKRLRLKETDRLESVKALILALGGKAEIIEDSLIVDGQGRLLGGTFDASGDHRLVMAATLATALIKSDLILLGTRSINKSYPNFFDDFNKLGGEISEF